MTAVLILSLQGRQTDPVPVNAAEVQTPGVQETVEITAMHFHAGQLYTGDHGGRIRVLVCPVPPLPTGTAIPQRSDKSFSRTTSW